LESDEQSRKRLAEAALFNYARQHLDDIDLLNSVITQKAEWMAMAAAEKRWDTANRISDSLMEAVKTRTEYRAASRRILEKDAELMKAILHEKAIEPNPEQLDASRIPDY
jgi:hypothetical protein